MNKVINVLPLVVIVVLLTACIMPQAQPFAAMSANMPQATHSDATTNATDQPAITPPLSTIESCTVTATRSLNLRSGAGTDNDVVKVLHNGDVLTVRNQRGEWWYVSTADGVTGYINSTYCNKG